MLVVNDNPNPYTISCNVYQRHVIVIIHLRRDMDHYAMNILMI